MEAKEPILDKEWTEFINEQVRVIINDLPSPYPKCKDGKVIKVTTTHLFLQLNDKPKPIALLLTDIRRIEIKGDN